MTDDQIRAALRQAVRDKIIYGWYSHAPFNGYEWCVVPHHGLAMQYTADGIADYVQMLNSMAA